VEYVDYVYAEMDAGRQIDAAYFDFKKTFDLVVLIMCYFKN
jgi:hypothetical protein